MKTLFSLFLSLLLGICATAQITQYTAFRITAIDSFRIGNGPWIKKVSTNLNSSDSNSHNMLPTNRAVMDAIRQFSGGGGAPANIPFATYQQINTMPYIAAWGNSLTRGYGGSSESTYPNWLSRLSGYSVYNMGVSGESSTQILQRIKADPAKWPMSNIFWMGRNNFSDSNRVLADIDTAVRIIGHSRFIILSIINGAYGTEDIGDPNYNRMMWVNDSLSRKYGSHYKDVRRYLVNQYNPLIPQDVIDFANDVPPSSLRADNLHLNDSGYKKVADFINANMAELAYPGDTTLGVSKVAYVFMNPPPIGLNRPNIIRASLVGSGKYPAHRFDTDSLGYYAINGVEVLGKRGSSLFMGSRGDNATNADENIFIGNEAGQSITSGDFNIGIGFRAGKFVTSGNGNTAIGYLSVSSPGSFNDNTAVGYRAMVGVTGSENTALGSGVMGSPSGNANTGVGYFTLASLSTGTNNTAVGRYAGRTISTGSTNTLIGMMAGESVATGTGNTAVGHWALRTSASSFGTALGYEAARSATISSITAVGFQTLRNTTTGVGNTGVGASAGLENTTGFNNTFIGYSSGKQNGTGSNNTGVGFNSLACPYLTPINHNTALGWNTGALLEAGAEKNIFIGSGTGDNTTTGSSNLLIGYKIRLASATDSGRLSLGNLIFGTGMDSGTTVSSGRVGIRTRNPTEALHINGKIRIDTVESGDPVGYFLTYDSVKKTMTRVLGTGGGNATNSITGNGSTGTPFKLVNDLTTPGINQYYGTNWQGTRGWQRSIIFEKQNAAVTFDGSTTTAYTVAVEDGTAGKVTVTFVGFETAQNQYIVVKRSVAYKKQSGVLTIGTVRNLETDEIDGLSSASGTLDANAGNIRALVTGQASKSIQWAVTILWEKVLPVL